MKVETAWNYIEFIAENRDDNSLLDELYHKTKHNFDIADIIFENEKEFFTLNMLTYY